MQHYHYDGSLTVDDYDQLIHRYKEFRSLESNKSILQVNPDYYTLWNDRRKLIPVEFDFIAELKWLIQIISVQPKSYWAWHHRLWCLSKVDLVKVWQKEMDLIQMYLNKDCRNFHVWDYRKRIIAKRYDNFWSNEIVLISELDFTSLKLTENFSNYSAWHWRAKVLEALSKVGYNVSVTLLNDVERLTNCFYCDPNDQSAWFYYNWFLPFCKINENKDIISALNAQHTQLLELLSIEPGCKWLYIGLIKISKFLGLGDTTKLKLKYKELDPLRGDIVEFI